MKENYETRIQSLEAKLQEAGVAVSRAEESVQRARKRGYQSGQPQELAANAFNPEMSVILDGKYSDSDKVETAI